MRHEDPRFTPPPPPIRTESAWSECPLRINCPLRITILDRIDRSCSIGGQSGQGDTKTYYISLRGALNPITPASGGHYNLLHQPQGDTTTYYTSIRGTLQPITPASGGH